MAKKEIIPLINDVVVIMKNPDKMFQTFNHSDFLHNIEIQ